MGEDAQLSIPPGLDRQAILERLSTVLDPELDESVLRLGFVGAIEAEKGHLTIELHLPTYWCAPNFSYLMASAVRQELLKVDNIQEVTVRLKGHFASEAIESGVNAGKSFTDAFPGEASENLERLRDLFLRKGYIKRQESFLRHLRNAGLSFEEIAALGLKDIHWDDETCWVCPEGAQASQVGTAAVARRYLARRAEIGLDCSPAAPLMCDLRGAPIPADKLETYFVHARTVRLSLEANGSLCSALLEARHSERDGVP